MTFGSNLMHLRESRGVSRKELAEKLGIPYTTLRNYETDKREPGHILLIKISSLFCVSVDFLIGNTQYAPSSTPTLTPTDLRIAHAYHDADDGIQASVRKLLDVGDTPEIDREVMSYRQELEAEHQGKDAALASHDAKMA